MVLPWSKKVTLMIFMCLCLTKKINSHSNRRPSRRKEAKSLNWRQSECLAFGVSTRGLASGKSRRWTRARSSSPLVLCLHWVRLRRNFKWNSSTNLRTRTWLILIRSTSAFWGMESRVQSSSLTKKQERISKCTTTLHRQSQKLPPECLVVFWSSFLLTSWWMTYTTVGAQKGVCAKFRPTSKCTESRKTQPSTN
jgi:hypothetical protein